MSYQKIFINALAEIFLTEEFRPASVSEKIYWLLDLHPPWVVPLVKRVSHRFRHASKVCNKQDIVKFLKNDDFFRDVWQKNYRQLKVVRFDLTPLTQQKNPLNLPLPKIQDDQQLSLLLGLTEGQLENYTKHWRMHNEPINSRLHHYHHRWIDKGKGEKRLIEAPKRRLAHAQREVYYRILDNIPLHETCHGFRKKHSCHSFAQPHSGQQVVIRMDIEQFFMSIPYRRIHAFFTGIGYNPHVATNLSRLCTYRTPDNVINQNTQLTWRNRKRLMESHLPQGSSCSPALANICSFKLDVRLAALANKFGANYTRYADDLAFSGGSDLTRRAETFATFVAFIAADEGFSINHRKTKIMHQGVSQHLTGLTVNRFPNIPRRQYDLLKATLFNCIKHGPASQNREKHPYFQQHLLGRIAHVNSINPDRAEKLYKLFRQIDWFNGT